MVSLAGASAAGGSILDDILDPGPRPARTHATHPRSSIRWGGIVKVLAALVALGGVVVGALVLFGGPDTFAPADGAYSLQLPSGWERVEDFEFAGPQGSLDLALRASNDSMIVVGRFDVPSGMTMAALPEVLNYLKNAGSGVVSGGRVEKSAIALADGSHPYEVTADFVTGGVEAHSRTAVVLHGDSEMIFFSLACPMNFCTAVEDDFDSLLSGIKLGD